MRLISRISLWFGVYIVAMSLAGCVSHSYAPIEQKTVKPEQPLSIERAPRAPVVPRPSEATPATHMVAKGETLHAVAWRYRLDYRDLVKWNRLANPNLIFIGQKLRLRAPSTSQLQSKAAKTKVQKPVNKKAQSSARKPTQVESATSPIRWVWPAQGKTQKATTASRSKGIEIRGTKGQAVKAAAPGTVVYSGSGLRGYGELIIIKHNDTFLSAYAHNDTRLANEGRRVGVGETIAYMGNTDAKDVMLHFEIRQNGKTVDPLKFLPKR